MKSKLSPAEWKKKLKEGLKKPKGLMLIGLAGILLIFLSTLLPSAKKSSSASFSVEEYRENLEKSVSKLVKEITGDRQNTVVITLDSGERYVYADSASTSSSNNTTDSNTVQNHSNSHSYITVRNESGGESALPVTVYMPQIRGVAIVCRGGNNPTVAEQVEKAVTAALHITNSRVYITGGNEK